MANGYVRYGNSIHLDGFQILDFCIENAISLESLRDLNLGRKVFLTGNDTNAGYLRENVWDGTKWRAAAYLDDIDKITNGEGSLGTRVKALEDMLGLQDVTDVIDTWNDVKEFFKDVDEGLNLMTMLDGKLDKTGGVMELDTIRSFEIKRKGSMSTIYFSNTNGALGFIGFNGSAQPIISDAAGSVSNIILHAGNFNDIARPLASGTWGIDISGSAKRVATYRFSVNNDITNLNGFFASGFEVGYATGLNDIITGSSDGFIVNYALSSDYGQQWFIEENRYDIKVRYNNGGNWSDWKTIAFTDSDITGNAATATALKNKVSLWGNEFDGTQSLNGSISFKDGDKLRSVLDYVNNSEFHIGYGTRTLNLTIWGTPIYFYANSTRAMTITEEGNVLVNHYDLEGVKFAVKGRVHIGDISTNTIALGQAPEYGLTLGIANLGMAQWVSTSGAGNIQSMAFNSATAYALNLNPLGGAVNVGDGGLNVNGTIKSGDKFLLTTTSMNLGSATTPLYFFLARPDANYIWASANGGYINLGVYDTGTTNSANATLSIYSDRVVSGQRNNAVSLGSSSYRWSNVYSTLGNFLGRVLIGGAEDDGESALQVKNTMSIGESKSAFGLRLDRSTIYAWIPEDYAYGHNANFGLKVGDALLGVFGHHREANGDYYAFIGTSHSSPWFTINSTESNFNVLTKFNGGALIPTGRKLTIGDANGDHATIEYDSIAKAIKVDGNMYTTGTLASGGKAKEGTGTGSGSANVRDFELPADEKTTYDCDHLLKSKNVIVQVFEKTLQNNIEVWEMIVADVTIVTEDRVTVTFGRPTTKVHKVHIIGGNVS